MAQLERPAILSSTVAPVVLSDERRQLILQILEETDRPLALRDLAEDIVRAERNLEGPEPDHDAIQQCRLTLYHKHIPKLAESDLVHYDSRKRTVRTVEGESATRSPRGER